jgi:hypothetical protein
MNCRDGQKQLTGCLVLLVDDHKDFLEAIRLFLSFGGPMSQLPLLVRRPWIF